MGPGPDYYVELNSPWAPAFFNAGFRQTIQGYNQSVTGLIRDQADASRGYRAHIDNYTSPLIEDRAATSVLVAKATGSLTTGAFLFRNNE